MTDTDDTAQAQRLLVDNLERINADILQLHTTVCLLLPSRSLEQLERMAEDLERINADILQLHATLRPLLLTGPLAESREPERIARDALRAAQHRALQARVLRDLSHRGIGSGASPSPAVERLAAAISPRTREVQARLVDHLEGCLRQLDDIDDGAPGGITDRIYGQIGLDLGDWIDVDGTTRGLLRRAADQGLVGALTDAVIAAMPADDPRGAQLRLIVADGVSDGVPRGELAEVGDGDCPEPPHIDD